ncbi:unnamed protein product, partial [Ixodes persulcatus]
VSSDCYVVAPNVFRLGSKETVAVAVEGEAAQQVEVRLNNLPNHRGVFFTETRRVNPRRPEVWDVGVELADLPDLTLGKTPVYVTLEVKCGSLWTRSAQVLNPQNVTVEARDFEPTTGPMLTHVVTLPEHTLLGEWKVVVKYGYKLNDGRASFRVDRDSIAGRLGAPLESLFRGRYRLVIEATVTEEATAAKQSARNEKAVFSTTPFVISTSRSQKSFKPGVKTYVIAQVTYLNGDAARGIEMQLTNRGPKNLSTKATTDKDGIATFPISTAINDDSLNLKVTL